MTREEEIIARAEEAEKEATFSNIVLKAKGINSAYGIGFLEGAVWADKTMIDKACEWLKSYRQDAPDGTGYIAGVVNDKTIEDFKEYMKGK